MALNTINQSINHLYLRIWSEIEIYVILTCKSGSFWSSRKYSTSSGVCAVTENNLCLKKSNYVKAWFRLMVFNATFNNISAISWRSVLLLKETGVPGENHRPAASHWKLYHIIVYRVHHAWSLFDLTTLVVISTDSIGSCKSNYHTITTTTTAP